MLWRRAVQSTKASGTGDREISAAEHGLRIRADRAKSAGKELKEQEHTTIPTTTFPLPVKESTDTGYTAGRMLETVHTPLRRNVIRMGNNIASP